MLRRLSGRSHLVLTGVALRRGQREAAWVETTRVWFAALNEDEIAAYVATGEPRDKAGAYAIQGRASRFIPRIAGSYTNVVGLPVASVWRLWRDLTAEAGQIGQARS
jgi:septum formation protein